MPEREAKETGVGVFCKPLWHVPKDPLVARFPQQLLNPMRFIS